MRWADLEQNVNMFTVGTMPNQFIDVDLRPCTRKDFEALGAQQIYDEKYKTNDELDFLVCPDKIDQVLFKDLRNANTKKAIDFQFMACHP